jgi:recombinational DNA repair ATPase RecF
MNVIYGNNAQGKTNFIEALWLFTGAKSFRGAKDSELVAFGQKDSELLLDFVNGGVKREAKITISSRRSAELDTNGRLCNVTVLKEETEAKKAELALRTKNLFNRKKK